MATKLPADHSPLQNQLLAALPNEVFDRLAQHLELVPMPLGQVLYESGSPMLYTYFPTSAIACLHYVLENGASLEIAGVGKEGIVGISAFLGGNSTPSFTTVFYGGYGYRLKARLIIEEFERAGALLHLLLRYTQALMTQVSQSAFCNRHHSIEQQLSRWLLINLDRVPTNELTITQELISTMLGVRREGITDAAGNLQRAGFIKYRRGHISVIDRVGLESTACECYHVVKKEFDRLLSGSSTPNKPLQALSTNNKESTTLRVISV